MIEFLAFFIALFFAVAPAVVVVQLLYPSDAVEQISKEGVPKRRSGAGTRAFEESKQEEEETHDS